MYFLKGPDLNSFEIFVEVVAKRRIFILCRHRLCLSESKAEDWKLHGSDKLAGIRCL